MTMKGQDYDPNTLRTQYLEMQFSNILLLLDSLLCGSTVGYPIATARLLVKSCSSTGTKYFKYTNIGRDGEHSQFEHVSK